MTNLFRSFFVEESGQDMIEYVLILAFVVIGAAGIAYGVGTDLISVWANTKAATADAATRASYTAGS